MTYLFDTNCWIRLADHASPDRRVVRSVLLRLRSQNHKIYTTPQIVSEFWNVCSRPASARNGLGFTFRETKRKTAMMVRFFELGIDNQKTFSIWHGLVIKHQVLGKQVHDTKIAASMLAHSIDTLVTFNVKDFSRYGLTVVTPYDI